MQALVSERLCAAENNELVVQFTLDVGSSFITEVRMMEPTPFTPHLISSLSNTSIFACCHDIISKALALPAPPPTSGV